MQRSLSKSLPPPCTNRLIHTMCLNSAFERGHDATRFDPGADSLDKAYAYVAAEDDSDDDLCPSGSKTGVTDLDQSSSPTLRLDRSYSMPLLGTSVYKQAIKQPVYHASCRAPEGNCSPKSYSIGRTTTKRYDLSPTTSVPHLPLKGPAYDIRLKKHAYHAPMSTASAPNHSPHPPWVVTKKLWQRKKQEERREQRRQQLGAHLMQHW